MLNALSSPSVCVIDDEQDDYEAILAVLNGCFISAVHLLGTADSLPPQPFSRLQLIFLDLHLNASTGKDAASHTANVFRRVVSNKTAPIIVVIWSKYAGDKLVTADVPAEDQETEAELFKRTLLEVEPSYKERLIFLEMPKPKLDDRPEDWHVKLKEELTKSLQGQSAIEVLWAWNEIVQEGCAQVSRNITMAAQAAIEGTGRSLPEGLTAAMQKLTKAQAEGDLAPAIAPKYLISVLSHLLLDQLENSDGVTSITAHGDWLSEDPGAAAGAGFPAKMNGLLFTSEHNPNGAAYAPGTVYRISDQDMFQTAFGKSLDELLGEWVKPTKANWQEWKSGAQPVLIELSPVCDLAQGNRINALLVAGVVVPLALSDCVNKSGDAYGKIAVSFYLRWAGGENFAAQTVGLGFCNRYKLTVPARQMAQWLTPWFRLRELPIASIRNANAAHAARVGYASVV